MVKTSAAALLRRHAVCNRYAPFFCASSRKQNKDMQ